MLNSSFFIPERRARRYYTTDIPNTTNHSDKDDDHGDDADGSDALSSPQEHGMLRIHEFE
jgi:hypothetical protein